MRRIGLVSLWAGVLAGSFVAVRHTDHIEWIAYGAAATLALVGVVLLRKSAAAEASNSEQVTKDVEGLADSMQRLHEGLATLLDTTPRAEVYDVRDQIDATLAAPLGAFAERREAMIAAYGIDVYADVMTRFAAAERLINRAWSASADGYIDEVWPCLERAQSLMQGAGDRLRNASAVHTPEA